MDVTKPYKFIGFGALDVTKPYEFIGLGAMDNDPKARAPRETQGPCPRLGGPPPHGLSLLVQGPCAGGVQ